MAVSEQSLRKYRSSWARMELTQIALAKHRRKKAIIEARQIASILKKDYGAKKVILFGSVIEKDKFKPDSDIDLAVFGIAPEKYYGAVATCMEHGEFKVDLVDGTSAGSSIKERIKRGIELNE